MKVNKLVFIGFGAVGYAVFEIMNKEKIFTECEVFIIEPRDITKPHIPDTLGNKDKAKARARGDVTDDWKGKIPVKFLQKEITKENYKSILGGDVCKCDDKTMILNLSVDVDSIMLMKYAKDNKCLYIDTSLENYPPTKEANLEHKLGTTYEQIKPESLYWRGIEAEKILKGAKTSIITAFGFNPGGVNQYAKKGLKEYARLKRPELVSPSVWKGDYKKLAKELELLECQIVELDTQLMKHIYPTDECFVNTWSCMGFELEASDNVMLSLNDEDLREYSSLGLIRPDEKKSHIRFLPERGMNVFRDSKTLDYEGKVVPLKGRLIPHQEIASLSKFFGDNVSIMYVYDSSKASQESLKYFKDNDYRMLKDDYVVWRDDVKPKGHDSIGALLHFKNGDEFWAGSVCSVEDCKRLGLLSGPTMSQVAGWFVGTMLYISEDPYLGFNYPETLPHKRIFKFASKYMGREYFKLL